MKSIINFFHLLQTQLKPYYSFYKIKKMSANIEEYLSHMEEKFVNCKTQQKAKTLNASVLNDIGNQIVQSRILFPEQQKKFKIKTTQPLEHLDVSKLDQKFLQINQKKKAILDQLHEIQLMESSIKFNRSTLKQSSVSTHFTKKSKVKSEFTEEDLEKIRQIYKKQKKFQKKLEMRTKKYEQDLQKFKQEKQKQESQKYRQNCLQKHEERQKHVEQIQQRNKQRTQILNQQKEKINQLKNKRKLFEKLETNFLKQKQIEAEEMKRKLKDHKKKRQFSFDEMKLHQEHYLEEKRAKDEIRQDKVKNFKDNQTKFPCLFLDRIKDQQERYAYQSTQKKQMVKTFAEKKSAYAEEVRKNLQVKIKNLSESKLSKISQPILQQAPKWLNTSQKYEQGTKYMRQINAKIAKLPRKIVQKNQEQKPKFKNYLNDLKKQDQERKNESKQNNINNVVNSMSILSAKQNITSKNLTQSIKAKIQLMNKLQNIE